MRVRPEAVIRAFRREAAASARVRRYLEEMGSTEQIPDETVLHFRA